MGGQRGLDPRAPLVGEVRGRNDRVARAAEGAERDADADAADAGHEDEGAVRGGAHPLADECTMSLVGCWKSTVDIRP